MVDESLGDAAEVFEASVDGFGGAACGVGVVDVVSSPGFCVGIFRPLSFVLLCVCFLLVAV